jgi:hypothetical protein
VTGWVHNPVYSCPLLKANALQAHHTLTIYLASSLTEHIQLLVDDKGKLRDFCGHLVTDRFISTVDTWVGGGFSSCLHTTCSACCMGGSKLDCKHNARAMPRTPLA